MLTPAAKTIVEVKDGKFHRPTNDPLHSGWLRCRLDDARLFAAPCEVCFPAEDDPEGDAS
jgi:hypothetical protein